MQERIVLLRLQAQGLFMYGEKFNFLFDFDFY